jgi:urea transporter
VAILPFPTLVLPFLIISWVLAALAPEVDILQPIAFSSVAETTFDPVKAVLSSLGEAILSPTVWSGSLFLAGVLLSNWRHALLALFDALIGTVVAYYYRQVDPASVDLGLYGFNGVLAAVAVFAVCGGKLRLAILGAILATMRMPVIAALGVQTVSAPFVFTTWLMLALGWVEEHWLAPPEPAAPAGPASGPDGASLPAAKQSGD